MVLKKRIGIKKKPILKKKLTIKKRIGIKKPIKKITKKRTPTKISWKEHHWGFELKISPKLNISVYNIDDGGTCQIFINEEDICVYERDIYRAMETALLTVQKTKYAKFFNKKTLERIEELYYESLEMF